MIVIKNGLLVDPHARREGEQDVLIDGETIKELGRPGSFSGLKEAISIDASGCWVVPGLIDMHVHLREPGYEWKETIRSGSQAAALGGFSTICCMANTSPVNDNAEITKFIVEKGREAGYARVLPVGAVSKGLKGKEMAPFSELSDAGCIAFSDDGEPVMDAGLMRRALEWCRMLGKPILCHEQDTTLTCGGCMNESPLSVRLGLKGMPRAAEDVMVARDIELSRLTGAKVHICHVSSARSVELIRRAKQDGLPVSAEVTPHHLLLTEERVSAYDTLAKMSPPLRAKEDIEALLQGLLDGTIDAIASDHAPHERDRKEVEFDKAAFGVIGLQSTLPLILGLVRSGKLSRGRMIEAMTRGPALVLGLAEAGLIAKGARADITIINPEYEWSLESGTIKSLSKNTPWLGQSMLGCAAWLVSAGRIVVRNMQLEAR